MRKMMILGLAALTGVAACAKKPVTLNPGATEALATRWNGRLAVPAGMTGVVQIQGDTWIAADGNRTRAGISLFNATPGGEHPWHVHRGQCGSNGPVVGDAGAYPILKIGGDGKAATDGLLDMPLPTDGEFYVNVHASTTNMQTIVACANLAAPTRR